MRWRGLALLHLPEQLTGMFTRWPVAPVLTTLLIFACLGGDGLLAQPRADDLVVAFRSAGSATFVGYFGVGTPTAMNTLLQRSLPIMSFGKIVMDRDNAAVLVPATVPIGGQIMSNLLRVDPIGQSTTLATLPSSDPVSVALDYDDNLIIGGTQHLQNDWLWGLDSRGTLTTFLSVPNATGEALWDLLVDRAPGGDPYAMMRNIVGVPSPWLQTLDRHRILSTIAFTTGRGVCGFALDHRYGDYLVASGSVMRITKRGVITTLNSQIGNAHTIHVQQDGSSWVGAWEFPFAYAIPVLYRMDEYGSVTSIVKFPNLVWQQFGGVVTYGSRSMVCNGSGKPGTTVKIRLQSRRSADRFKPYALACSLARRPGIRFRNGDWLDLHSDALFFVSASGSAPAIFQNFGGMTDSSGGATASVNIPASVPRGLGITIFVAGIVYDVATGVQTTTNSHWFVLS